MQWRPMTDAPKDGTRIRVTVFYPDYRDPEDGGGPGYWCEPKVYIWDESNDGWYCKEFGLVVRRIDERALWMPEAELPAPLTITRRERPFHRRCT